MSTTLRRRVPPPIFRKLRVFAIDPGMTARFETAVMNEMTLAIPWEPLEPGPIGEYLEIVDEDEAGHRVNEPVNLDHPDILGQNGLHPSDGNPRFHQQMVYAVAMRTIRNFERALGRTIHWAPRPKASGARKRGPPVSAYERRLKVYPHYTKQANAFFDPANGLCFGYFQSNPDSPFPGTTVYTCLSQDVVAHSLTHAVLTGMGISFEGSSPDVAALHEAFADAVSLLQHFAPSEVLRHQIASVRGHLEERSALGAVGVQFGEAIGMPDGLRNALGFSDKDGQWHARIPDPNAYATVTEPHERGDILLGAVFDALKKIYESRVADLRRIASKGTGILTEGSLHPDLVDRLAQEASHSAQRVLELCLRALDFIPPVETTFGDFLRAIVTADYDASPADKSNDRLAFVDAFRRHGIMPAGVGTLSQETLLWPQPPAGGEVAGVSDFVRKLSLDRTPWNLPTDRQELWEMLLATRRALQESLSSQGRKRDKRGKRLGPIDLGQPFEVQSFHPRERGTLAGDLAFQWVIKLVQSVKPAARARKGGDAPSAMLAGVTLIVDGDTGRVRYQIEKSTTAVHVQRAEKRTPVIGAAAVNRPPTERRLRVFAFDPSLGVQLETAQINEVTLRVPWERDAGGADILEPGPVGEYLEVVDRDPASACFYDPVDLNDQFVLAQDGLPPSESNPQFHQQMVYAVAMRTIRTFEQALGRLALWRPHRTYDADAKVLAEDYVQRLRVHPHALREANAYYSPEKKAVLFGYFQAPVVEGSGSVRPTVFTCMSHDIIAHEVTHALLDGMHRRFNEPSNPDVLAFHEAFADLVALFQHFSLPEVLHHQIAWTRGDLASQNRLGELAQQFGQAIGKRGALRNAIGETDPATGQWRRTDPTPGDYQKHLEPHDRGAVLVAAVFDAFLSIYKGRVADLLRIATEGTGVLPAGNLHPDLVNRLVDEAARSARQVLEMCIRALDYCPPVDINFGDYLRAVVTADFEHDPVDTEHRRVAFIEAFRRRGIVPDSVRAFSVDGLLWRTASAAPDVDEEAVVGIVKAWAADISSWGLSKDRRRLSELMRERRAQLHQHLDNNLRKGKTMLGGIDPALKFEVHSLRPSIRVDWEGKPNFQWVIELTQRVPQYFSGDRNRRVDDVPDYYFRGGCTLLVDAQTGKVRYGIKKRLTDERKAQQRRYAIDEGSRSLAATYFGGVAANDREPFAMLHRH